MSAACNIFSTWVELVFSLLEVERLRFALWAPLLRHQPPITSSTACSCGLLPYSTVREKISTRSRLRHTAERLRAREDLDMESLRPTAGRFPDLGKASSN